MEFDYKESVGYKLQEVLDRTEAFLQKHSQSDYLKKLQHQNQVVDASFNKYINQTQDLNNQVKNRDYSNLNENQSDNTWNSAIEEALEETLAAAEVPEPDFGMEM